MTTLFWIFILQLLTAILCTGASALPNSPQEAAEKQIQCGASYIHHSSDDNSTNDLPVVKRKRRYADRMKDVDEQLRQFVLEVNFVIAKDMYDGFRNKSEIVDYVKNIVKEVDYFMKEINVRVVLSHTEMWKISNPFNITADIYQTHTEMTEHYRKLSNDTTSPWVTSDVTILMTSVEFNFSRVGIAPFGGVCAEMARVILVQNLTVNYDTAFLIAHEIGHLLGIGHIQSSCHCPHSNCVMKPVTSTPVGEWAWSECARQQLNQIILYEELECLRDPISTSNMTSSMTSPTISYPVCGNEVVEENEDCDCGDHLICKSRCCNPHTCKFLPSFECDSGECCSDCKFKSRGHLCRPTGYNECQLPDYCGGKSAECPTGDLHLRDGSSCGTNNGTCKDNQCISHTQECKKRVAPDTYFKDRCYAGNADERCTSLWCVKTDQENLRGTYKSWKRSYIRTDRFPKINICLEAHLFKQDGLTCGSHMLCSGGRCIEDPLKSCEDKCNGKGVCNNNGNCHCNDGWQPPFCDRPGIGGSNETLQIRTPSCGDGVVDENEECDCWSPEKCADSCCDPLTCKRRSNTTQCQEKNPDNLCDLPKFCNGPGNTCSADRYKMDGSRCGKSGSCYRGRCVTVRQQCKNMFGLDAREPSSVCFKRNSLSLRYGNCGKDENGHFVSCSEQDNKCGKIWCTVPKIARYPQVRSLRIRYMGMMTNIHGKKRCTSVRNTFMKRKTGLVREGTKCGSKSMCMNQKCVQTEVIACRKQRCHGEGFCDNLDGCYDETH